jgi:TolA-binding protein
MKIQTERINRYLIDTKLSKVDDPVLVAEIRDYIRAQLDMDEIMNDPSLEETRSETKNIVNSFKEGVIKSDAEIKDFVNDTLSHTSGQEIKDDITDIRVDLSKTSIDDVSAEWVKDWHRRKQMQGAVSKERINFISKALKESETEKKPISFLNVPTRRISIIGEKPVRRMLRFISLSAAAILGAVILFKSIHPSNPQKLFSSFYEPFTAVSPIVRGNNTNDLYISGINSFKTGDYKNAAKAFEQSSNINPLIGSPVFYLGLTALETGDYDKAIKDLNSVVAEAGVYSKEAEWYLGLAYLKKGNTEDARKCFEELSKTSSYYKDRSEKILRRLK